MYSFDKYSISNCPYAEGVLSSSRGSERSDNPG